ncbi:MAG TPA: type I pullulanase [Bacillales bacterium]|nr:type I pullulanase [Bacillales bacterium]
MTPIERQFLAYLDEMEVITILLPQSYHNGQASAFYLTSPLQKIPLKIQKKTWNDPYVKYTCCLSEEISFHKTYWVVDEHGGKTDLQFGAVIRTTRFDEMFFYDGDDLGIYYEETQTQFKLWAPIAAQVELKLFSPNGSLYAVYPMKREAKGIWTALVCQDLEYYLYIFRVNVNQQWQEAIDPYAIAVTPNGEMGVIVNREKTHRPKPKLPPFTHPVDAIIYETHIRDFTIHPNSGVRHKGRYLGAAELNTTGKNGQLTGLSYLKELGITHIEFLPIHDFAGVDERKQSQEYNWGYNPVHFNVPDGSYATDPADPYSRIVELKHLVEEIHHMGLRVILDVVYNHVYIREQSSFEKIVPGYYFRHNELGFPSNGTGVGNDLASERKMVRKYILDSIRFWVEEYHIDGFRFDLMGVLDVDTMNAIQTLCERLSEGILLLGEGWNLNTPLPEGQKASLMNQAQIPGIAQFNDLFRDTIKGSTFQLDEKGYAFGNEHYLEHTREAMAGSVGVFKKEIALFNEPTQTVNYVECHDNHTMWDKLFTCYPSEKESILRKYHRLATCMVLLAQGIPFLHSGQEFFRTKYGVGNSYCSPDSINQLDWDRKDKYIENVQYIKEIIEIRKTFACFRMKTADEISRHMLALPLPSPLLGYKYHNLSGSFDELRLLINPTLERQEVQIPNNEWVIFADEKSASMSQNRKLIQPEIIVEPISLMIIGKNSR